MATYKRRTIKKERVRKRWDAEALVVRTPGEKDGSRLTFISARLLEVLGNYLSTISKLLEIERKSGCINSVQIEKRRNNM